MPGLQQPANTVHTVTQHIGALSPLSARHFPGELVETKNS